MEATQSAIVTALVIAVVQVVKYIKAKDWESLLTIASAVVVGVIAGLLGIEGLNTVTGAIAGFTAVGAVTVASKIGGSQ
jgi:hypothetical protein